MNAPRPASALPPEALPPAQRPEHSRLMAENRGLLTLRVREPPAAWHDGGMALSKKLLSRDEVVVRHMHTHIKVLLWRFVVEILLLVVGVVASVMAPATWQPWGIVAIWVVILVVSVPLLLLPWLQWYMHTYTITTKRIITRSGIISRVGHDLPLTRISDIQLDKDVTDRFFGCGTLALQTSADDPLLLHDVPQVEMVQVEISNLIFDDTQGAIDADPRS